jgi:anti-sigma regulatory factor (Ser/Thr protein kinase)
MQLEPVTTQGRPAGKLNDEKLRRALATKFPDTGVHSAEFGATPEAVRAARAYVKDVLTSWAFPDDHIDTAKLLTSELATNAVIHGQGDAFTLEVRSFGCCFGVEVTDNSASAPTLRAPEAVAETGRGLLLIAELADSWGYYFTDARKHVWFHLHLLAQYRRSATR